jgi:hypothetical protein
MSSLPKKILGFLKINQIKTPGGHDTTFIISTYTMNKVKYNNYFITINHPVTD